MSGNLLSGLVRSDLLVSGAGLIIGGAVSGVDRSRLVEEVLEPVSSRASMSSPCLVSWARTSGISVFPSRVS